MLYICWSKENHIKGVATSKKHAEKMCDEIGDCYTPIEPNTVPKEDTEITKISTHRTQFGFFTYQEAKEIVKELVGVN